MSNTTTVERSGKCLRTLIDITKNYDSTTGVSTPSGHHTSKSLSKDLRIVLEELNRSEVFKNDSKRMHSQFPTFTQDITSKINKGDLLKWLQAQLKKQVNQLNLT